MSPRNDFSADFGEHASPQAIRVELRKARVDVQLAKRRVHALECLLERRELAIADGEWPTKAGKP